MPTAPATAPTAPGIPGAEPVQAMPNNGSSAPASSQALLVSSAPARAATAANVTKLNTITAPAPPSLQPAVNAVNNSVNAYNKSVLPDTSSTPSSSQSSSSPVSAVTTSPDGTTKTEYDTSTPPAPVGGTTAPPTDGTTAAPAGGQPGTTPKPAGSSTQSPTDPYAAAVASIPDPGIAAQFKASLAAQDQEAQTLQATITSLRGATAATDPATMAAVAAIQAKYDMLISAMQAKNTQVIGRASSQAAAFGGLGVQGNAISGTFMSNETAAAQQRITTLQDQESSLILQAQAAFSANNSKALNDAMTQYDTINQQKTTALNDLLTSMSKQVTAQQSQQKIDLTATKDQVSNDVAQSTKIAAGIAANISAAGLTDPTQIQAYIQGIAAQYGISNPDILYSQVVTAGQTTQKNATSIANTQDEITNRDAGTAIKNENVGIAQERVGIAASKAATGTLSAQKSNALDGINQLAVEGVTDSNGVPYVIKAANGSTYFTKQGFQTLLNAALADGVSRATFLATYPQLLQPGQAASYGLTPAEAKKAGI